MAGVLIAFGSCALVYNVWYLRCPHLFFAGVASSQFTFFITLVYLVGGIAAPFAGNLLQKHDLVVLFGVGVAMVALGLFLCSFWNHIYLFYVSGVVVGFGIVSLMFLAIPTLINRWIFLTCGFVAGHLLCHVRSWGSGLEHGRWTDYRRFDVARCLSGIFCPGSRDWPVRHTCLRS